MTYTKETGKKWENENGKTSHMKVSMVNDVEECEKECTATVPCIAFTFILGLEICALKAPNDAVTMVPAGGEMISGRLDGERPRVHQTSQELRMLSPSLCSQRSQCNCSYLLFSIVRNVISVSSAKSQVTKTFKKSEKLSKNLKNFKKSENFSKI